MTEAIKRFLKRPAIAHLVRTGTRFSDRNGTLFAGAITYRSMLTLVPILMLIFSLVGLVITSFWPHLVTTFRNSLTSYFGPDMDKVITPILDSYFTGFGWASLTALGVAFWTGTGWIGSLRSAIRFQLADHADERPRLQNPIFLILSNMVTFLVFILLTIATFALSTFSTSLNKHFVEWLGLEHKPGVGFLVQVGGLAVTALAGMVLFMFLFWALSERRIATRLWVLGSLIAGVGLMVLQASAGLITTMLSRNISVSIFGSVIVIMLFFNLYATLILATASWIGTADLVPAPVAQPAVVEVAATGPQRGPIPARATGVLLGEDFDPAEVPAPDPNVLIPQDVAARGVRIGSGVGYGLGALTGLGFGTLLASAAKGLLRRK